MWPGLPVDGGTTILGNDIAGSRARADVAPPVIVAPTPLASSKPDKNETEFPEVFTARAVTRGTKRAKSDGIKFTGHNDAPRQHGLGLPCIDLPWSVSHSKFVAEQRAHCSLKGPLELARPAGEVKSYAQCYFVDNDVLMRKWVPQWKHFVGEPVDEVVVPSRFRDTVLQVSHDESGHLGVRKSYDRIPRYFDVYKVTPHLSGNR